MNRNWLYTILGMLLIAWFGQLYWPSSEETEEPVNQKRIAVEKKKDTSDSGKNNISEPVEKKAKAPQVISPPIVKEPKINHLGSSQNNNTAVIAELQSSRLTNYDRISGYPAMITILEQECGNLIDTELERVVIDVNRLSGLDIFVSKHFCMESAILGKLNRIPSPAEFRLEVHVNELQASYDNLLNEIEDNTAKVIVTKQFLNIMAQHYSILPSYERLGSDRFHIAVLVLSPIRDAKRIFVWPMRFKLLNRHETPQYVFKDVLDNVLPEKEAQITAEYENRIAEIFTRQKLLFEQINGQS